MVPKSHDFQDKISKISYNSTTLLQLLVNFWPILKNQYMSHQRETLKISMLTRLQLNVTRKGINSTRQNPF